MVHDSLLERSPNIRVTDASLLAFTAIIQLRYDPVLQLDLRRLPAAMLLFLSVVAGPEPDLRDPIPESSPHF